MSAAAPALDREALAELARVHPTAWAIYASQYAGDGTWSNAAHFDFLSDRVLRMVAEADRVRAGGAPSDVPGSQRLCVSMPPGSGKSEYLSFAVASWLAATRPRDRVVVASYSKSLALGWSERARDALAALGLEVFGVDVNARQKAELWQVRDPETGAPYLPGYFYAVGRGGAFTGKRAEWLFIDDLLKDDEEARSSAVRTSAWRWLDKVALTRLLPHSCVIQIGTRWHSEDTIGRLEKKQRAGQVELPWEFVNLPALAEADDALGREPGEPLWPSMWSRDRMERIKRGRDPFTWAALFQGRPVPEGGGLFKSDWIRSYTSEGEFLVSGGLRVPRARLRVFSTCDLAGSKKQRADWTVIATWGIDHKTRTLWLLDLRRARMEAPEIVSAMADVRRELGPSSFYVERAGPQLNYLHALKLAESAGRKLDPGEEVESEALVSAALDAGIPVRKLDPVGDKVTRSGAAQALMSNGRLLTPSELEADWIPLFIEELCEFPEGSNDDQVDVTSYAARVFLEVLAASRLLEDQQEEHDLVGGSLGELL